MRHVRVGACRAVRGTRPGATAASALVFCGRRCDRAYPRTTKVLSHSYPPPCTQRLSRQDAVLPPPPHRASPVHTSSMDALSGMAHPRACSADDEGTEPFIPCHTHPTAHSAPTRCRPTTTSPSRITSSGINVTIKYRYGRSIRCGSPPRLLAPSACPLPATGPPPRLRPHQVTTYPHVPCHSLALACCRGVRATGVWRAHHARAPKSTPHAHATDCHHLRPRCTCGLHSPHPHLPR